MLPSGDPRGDGIGLGGLVIWLLFHHPLYLILAVFAIFLLYRVSKAIKSYRRKKYIERIERENEEYYRRVHGDN